MKIKLTFWRVVFLVIMALGLYSAFVRYFRGLGAVSNMTDQFPWGLWIGFDCLCGVMLAAGGFCMVGAVYLFNVERLHSVVRPAVLTAFLGYLLFHRGIAVRSWPPLVHLASAHLHESRTRSCSRWACA